VLVKPAFVNEQYRRPDRMPSAADFSGLR
jgi:hypothetical protein